MGVWERPPSPPRTSPSLREERATSILGRHISACLGPGFEPLGDAYIYETNPSKKGTIEKKYTIEKKQIYRREDHTEKRHHEF